MAKKKINHKYLILLYSRVDEFLANEQIPPDDMPDVIVSFCTAVEKILKIKLHNKNPLLVFDPAKFKEDDSLSIIALKKEKDIETAKVGNIISRFEIVFKKAFTPDEFQALRDIYEVRNCFVHGYKTDDKIVFDAEDLVKKMGTVWEKIAKIAISLFGKENIKNGRPKKKYTEKELEKVLEDEVRKMIQPGNDPWGRFPITTAANLAPLQLYNHEYASYTGDRCPRCGSYTFSLDSSRSGFGWPSSVTSGLHSKLFSAEDSRLYKCSNCNLEMTDKQYEIARRISK
jgi:DNA-directed RNA polymerase subunit RPC12/RpoP